MNKWQIICPLVAMAVVAVIIAIMSGRNHHRHFVSAHTWMIGQELIATTNSARLVQIESGFQKELADFLASPAGIANVEFGDEPSPIGDGTACSRLIMSNAIGGRLGIRLRQDAEPERFHVLSFWSISVQHGPANGSRPIRPETNGRARAAGSRP